MWAQLGAQISDTLKMVEDIVAPPHSDTDKLVRAVEVGGLDTVRFYLTQKRISANHRGSNGMPLLLIASLYGHVHIVRELRGVQYALEIAHEHAERAEKRLQGLEQGPTVDSLRDSLSYVVDRRH